MTEEPEVMTSFTEEPSSLLQRLHRRYTSPIGFINTAYSQAHYNRLTNWLNGRSPLMVKLNSRRLLEDKLAAVPGVFVFRENDTSRVSSNKCSSNDENTNEKNRERSIKTNTSLSVALNSKRPLFQADSSEHFNAIKSRGTKTTINILKDVNNATAFNSNTKDNPAKLNQILRASTDQKLKQETTENDVAHPDNQETVWRLRRVRGNYPEKKDLSINLTREYNSTEIENKIDQLAENKAPLTDRFYLRRRSMDKDLPADTLKNKPYTVFVDSNTSINQQEAIQFLSDPDKKLTEQIRTTPIVSKADKGKEIKYSSKELYPIQDQPFQQTKPANLSKNSDLFTAGAFDPLSPHLTTNQSHSSSDNGLIWQHQKIKRLDLMLQKKGNKNSESAQLTNQISELSLLVSDLSQPDLNGIKSETLNANKLVPPINENLNPEFQQTSQRLSKREWTQLIDQVSRIIMNKLIVDLDRRGIRVWR